ncbi:MAG: manganese efflux pump MntP family protein [Acidimicrobiales bacterium]
MLRLALVAVALGLSNFAAAIGIGLSGVDAQVRLRVGVVFGAFEAAMPVLGLLLGHRLAHVIGSASGYAGGGLLIVAGVYTVLQARLGRSGHAPIAARPGTLVATGAALSVDNLVVGFALGTQEVPLVVSAAAIAAVSVGMSLVGLELGSRLGGVAEKWSQEIGGAVLVSVGAAIAAGLF